MEKRVDLAVTLVHDPAVIILDEPFNGLDISLQRFIWELLQELAQQGKIIIITSHLLEDIQRYCTRFGLVENGVFYGNDALRDAVQRNRSASLQSFLEQLFRKDLLMEGGGKR
jgi:ABC-type multidrug transport system ATPase subunit